MANHIKPSKEELKANIDAAAAALDKTPPVPSPSAPIPSPSAPVPSPSAPIPSPSAPIPSPSAPVPSQQAVDYRKRYSDSTREAQVLASKNRDINRAIDQAATLPDPTPEELTQEYPDYEDMSDTERRFAKENLINKRRFELINSATQKYKAVDEWQEKVNTFVDDPKTVSNNPELDGKEEEFRVFASKPSRVGVDFDDLILAFLGEEAKNRPAPKKGKMFEVGSGGPNDNPRPASKKIPLDEAKILREKNFPKYKELLKAGKIETGA